MKNVEFLLIKGLDYNLFWNNLPTTVNKTEVDDGG